MLVYGLERGSEPLARFLVEALDALTEPLDCFDEVVALRGEAEMLLFDLGKFLVGP